MSTIFDKFDKPACAETLGWRFVAFDAAEKELRVAFDGRDIFSNPAGNIQGGFLAAMLDDVMGGSVLAATDGDYFAATIDLVSSFITPARKGTITGIGRVVSLGKSISFMHGELRDSAGGLIARGSASARLVPTVKLPSTASVEQ